MNWLPHSYKKIWSETFKWSFISSSYLWYFPSSTSAVSLLLVSRRCWRARGPPAPEEVTSCGWSWEMSSWAWRSSNRCYGDTLPSHRALCQVTVTLCMSEKKEPCCCLTELLCTDLQWSCKLHKYPNRSSFFPFALFNAHSLIFCGQNQR